MTPKGLHEEPVLLPFAAHPSKLAHTLSKLGSIAQRASALGKSGGSIKVCAQRKRFRDRESCCPKISVAQMNEMLDRIRPGDYIVCC